MGYLHVYTGDGKGKTTCALGLLMRAVGAGMRVAFLQFDKGFDANNEHYSERKILRSLPGVDLFFFGLERMMPDGKFRFANVEGDLQQAQAGLAKARELIAAHQHDLVILDEAVTCVGTKLYAAEDLIALVQQYRETGECELVLTGRGATPELIEAVDLVTEMTLVKHYWYTRQAEARRGIDY